MSNWIELFYTKASVYALNDDTKVWEDRGSCGKLSLYKNTHQEADAGIKWTKSSKSIMWRLIGGKTKPKGERAIILKAYHVLDNKQEILALRFTEIQSKTTFLQHFESIFHESATVAIQPSIPYQPHLYPTYTSQKNDNDEKYIINKDEVLFKIWSIIYGWKGDDVLSNHLSKNNIKTPKDLKEKSVNEIFEFVLKINWNDCKITKKHFLDKYDALIRESKLNNNNYNNSNNNHYPNYSPYLYKQYNPHNQHKRVCSKCTYTNNPTATKCEVCGAALETKNQKWSCAVCTYQNDQDAHKCIMCGLPRDSSNKTDYRSNIPNQGSSQMNSLNNSSPMYQMQAPQQMNCCYNSAPTAMIMNNNSYHHQLSNTNHNNKIIENFNNESENIGFSVGGAKDINSFRDNIIKKNRMPQINSISFEGIYYDYYFDTNTNETGIDVKNNDDDEVIKQKQVHLQQEGDKKQNENDEMDEKKQDDQELPLFYPSYCYSKSVIPNALLCAYSKNVQKKYHDMIDDDDDENTKYDLYNFNIDEQIKNGDNIEHFMTIGLNSNVKVSDFERKKLNLVIVLDISGSMCRGFKDDNCNSSKMKIANQCLLSIITHLNTDDRFGLVLFNHTANVCIPFKEMKNHNLMDFEDILNIKERGGTNFEAGYNLGIEMFQHPDFINDEWQEYENRLVLLTDACPNFGRTDSKSLMNFVKNAAAKKDKYKRIYTTFVGVGLDFNVDLISEITKVRGANYFAVHSSTDFFKKLDLEFDYFVSPMVFDLKLILQSEGNEDNSCIETVYGSNNIDIKTGEILKIDTLFPSPPNDAGHVKGGIVLIKLQKSVHQNSNLIIHCSFENKFGKKFKNTQRVMLFDISNKKEYYPNIGIRKAILLTKYVLLIKQWIKQNDGNKRSAIKVDDKYKQIFKMFLEYFQKEMKIIRDEALDQEVKLIQTLIGETQ